MNQVINEEWVSEVREEKREYKKEYEKKKKDT